MSRAAQRQIYDHHCCHMGESYLTWSQVLLSLWGQWGWDDASDPTHLPSPIQVLVPGFSLKSPDFLGTVRANTPG